MDRKATGGSGPRPGYRHPFAHGERLRSWGTRGDDEAVGSHKPGCQGDQLVDIAGASHDHGVEPTGQLSLSILHPIRNNVRSFELELANDGCEKGGPTAA